MTEPEKANARQAPDASPNSTSNTSETTEDEVDLQQAWMFLRMLDPEADMFTFQTFDDGEGKRGQLARIIHGDPEGKVLSVLAKLNQAGAGVFVTVNRTDGHGRRERNVVAVRAVFVDLDGAPLAPIAAAAPAPHLVCESSPGRYHAYWIVDDCPMGRFSPVQLAIARKYGGDEKVHDLPRVMRIPGFLHRKGPPFRSRLLTELCTQANPYTLAEIVGGLHLQLGERREETPHVPPRQGPRNRKFSEGRRNDALFRLGATLRRDGLERAAIEAALLATNTERCVPPLADAEVRSIAGSAARYPAGELAAAPAAPAAVWPAPLLPSSVQVPEISCEIIPGVWGEMAAAVARSTQTPPAASALIVLGMLAAILQRRFDVAPWGDDYHETLSLWILVALPSGARKTAILGALRAPIDRWEKTLADRLRPEIARRLIAIDNAEARIARLRADYAKAESDDKRESILAMQRTVESEKPAVLRAPRLVCGDVTPETLQTLLADHGERMTVVTDEAGLFTVLAGLYSGGAAHLDVFLQAWSGASVKVDRANRHAYLDRPALSQAIALQPDVLQEVAGVRRFRDSGLLARYLYAVPRSTVGARDVRSRHPVPEELRQRFEVAVLALLDGAEKPARAPVVIPFTVAAREVWLDLHETVERDMRAGGRLEPVADWAAKLPGQTARIAALMQLGHTGLDTTYVDEDMVRRAGQLAHLLIEHALAAFRMLGADGIEADALHLLRWIQAEGAASFDRPQAQKALEGRFRTVERLKAAAARLADWHVLSNERTRANPGARPTPFYLVNPRLFDNPGNSPENE